MRILQTVKTVDGAQWALDQVSELVKRGIVVHVLLPRLRGRFIDDWRRSGAFLHELPMDLPLRKPWHWPWLLNQMRRLVSDIKPDIIHSHFFITTLILRYALGRKHPIPRLFQVPGPSHLEHGFFRLWEISSAGPSDAWIASSNYTRELYLKAGVSADRVFLSYYGNRLHSFPPEGAGLRNRYKISEDKFVVGNVNYMYAPRFYLGQTRGIKRHEDVIDAIARVINTRRDTVGILIGGQWGSGDWYERRLKKRASKRDRGRIIMTGRLPASQAKTAWIDFDVALHVPVSENCGGVVEPLMAGVPVIAARTGGLPEVVLPGVTGKLVAPRDPGGLASAISEVLDDLNRYRQMAYKGTQLVRKMFDVRRTAEEIEAIYSHMRDNAVPKPEFFNSREYLERLYGKAE